MNTDTQRDSSSSLDPTLLHVGTSGWNYPEWRGKFYPKGLAQAKELGYIAERFDTLEINSSFYRLMRPSTYEKWARAVPDGFTFAVKGWKQITHMRRLKNAGPDVARFFGSGVRALGAKMGPILWQLPPSLKFDGDVLEEFLNGLPKTFGEMQELAASAPPPPTDGPEQDTLLPPDVATAPADRRMQYALEPRSATFSDPEAAEILRKYDVAMVIADTAGRYPQFDEVTADLVYVRLHGSPRLYFSNYSQDVLAGWAQEARGWIAQERQVYFYFDNTGAGWAPQNALTLQRLVTGT